MRVVVDTNQLQSDELRVFLAATPNNLAVLPEHTTSEIFKPASLEGVYASFDVLKDFPNQIVQLQANRFVNKVDVTYPGFANRFIDKPATAAMPTFIKLLSDARSGNIDIQQQLVERRTWATERQGKGIAAFGDISEDLTMIRAIFSDADLATVSRNDKVSQKLILQLLDVVDFTSNDIFIRQTGRNLPSKKYRFNNFTWRYVLCHFIQLLYLASKGSKRRNPLKAANDHLDNVFAAYATFYNGLMTNDETAFRTHVVSRVILEQLDARVPEDYLGSGYIHKLYEERARN